MASFNKRLEPEASLYFGGAANVAANFPRARLRSCATRDSRIAAPEAEDRADGGVEQRPCQLARSHFRSLIEKLVRISVLVDRNSLYLGSAISSTLCFIPSFSWLVGQRGARTSAIWPDRRHSTPRGALSTKFPTTIQLLQPFAFTC